MIREPFTFHAWAGDLLFEGGHCLVSDQSVAGSWGSASLFLLCAPWD